MSTAGPAPGGLPRNVRRTGGPCSDFRRPLSPPPFTPHTYLPIQELVPFSKGSTQHWRFCCSSTNQTLNEVTLLQSDPTWQVWVLSSGLNPAHETSGRECQATLWLSGGNRKAKGSQHAPGHLPSNTPLIQIQTRLERRGRSNPADTIHDCVYGCV